jgi:signal transduction histidine kinase
MPRASASSAIGPDAPTKDARPDGSGLLGLNDRLATLGGQLRLESPPGHGTRIAAILPLRQA